MKLNKVIRTRRQALGLTQEQLAQKLGVSAPAVNKWERNLNYPDITLLPVLARTLGVDLNTLLSFQEDLTDQEIGLFLNQLYETSQEAGCGAAFQLARDKLREYPNSDKLALQRGGHAGGRPGPPAGGRRSGAAGTGGGGLRPLRAVRPQRRFSGAGVVHLHPGSRCVKTGELDRAEELLDQLSDTHRRSGSSRPACAGPRGGGRRPGCWWSRSCLTRPSPSSSP